MILPHFQLYHGGLLDLTTSYKKKNFLDIPTNKHTIFVLQTAGTSCMLIVILLSLSHGITPFAPFYLLFSMTSIPPRCRVVRVIVAVREAKVQQTISSTT